MKNYPCHNDVYASQYVLEYIEANWSTNKRQSSDNNSMKIKKMMVAGSRKGKRHKKRINPFREDVFACGITLLQLANLYS